MATRRHRPWAAIAAAGVALALSGCGGGGDEPDGLDDLVDDLQNGDASALDELDAADLGDLLGELADDSPGDLAEGSGIEDPFGEEGPLAALEDLLGDDGSLEGLADLFGEDLSLEDLAELIEEQSDGALDIDVGDGEFSVESEDGNVRIGEDGEFSVTDDQGNEVTGDLGADGDGFSVESDDGRVSVESTDELPDDWPAEVPTPDGLAIDTVTVADNSDALNLTVTGTVDGDTTAWIEGYGEQLQDAGFAQNTFNRTGDDASGFYQSDGFDVFVVGASFGETATVTVALTAR